MVYIIDLQTRVEKGPRQAQESDRIRPQRCVLWMCCAFKLALLLAGLEVREAAGVDRGGGEGVGLLVEVGCLVGVVRITFAGLGVELAELRSATRFFTASQRDGLH